MGRGLFTIALVFILLILSPSVVIARHGRVLGDATDSSNVDLLVNQGPGLLLPSSPLYFLDLWRDSFSLMLASFDQEAKARLHLKIAGERITEVKLMLEGKDVDSRGLDIALANIAENVEGAALSLNALKNRGQNVERLAVELDQIIDTQQSSLRIIAKAHGDKFKLKIKAVEEEIEEDEVEIEDELPEDEFGKEVADELEEEIEDEREEASRSLEKVKDLEEELQNIPTPKPTPKSGGSGSSGSGESGSGSSGSGDDDDDSSDSSGSGSSGSGSSGSGSGDND